MADKTKGTSKEDIKRDTKVPEKKKAQSYADKDRQLVKALEKATHDLMEHRWHWTQDDGNDKAVSVEDYALESGAAREDVHRFAAAHDRYELMHAGDESYTAVMALDETNVGAATMR